MNYEQLILNYLSDLTTTVSLDDITKYVFDYCIDNGVPVKLTIKSKLAKIVKNIVKSYDYKIINKNPLMIAKSDSDVTIDETIITHERDLHSIFERYLLENNIHSKTVYHEKSSQYSELKWMHPDIIGFKSTTELFTNLYDKINISKYDIYSYELKRKIDFSTLKPSYFQAVSNSSWANYGYLVTEEIDLTNSELINEIKRLHSKYGIGLILINTVNLLETKIIIEARKNPIVDMEFINLLANKNEDFYSFFLDLR